MKSRLFACLLLLLFATVSVADEKIKALIIDGQNNHGDWPKNTALMKQRLEESGKFTVDIERSKYLWNGGKHFPKYALHDEEYELGKKAKTDPDFKPQFAKYDVTTLAA